MTIELGTVPGQETTETVTTDAPAVDSATPAVTVTPNTPMDNVMGKTEAAPVVEKPAYTPNFKFKTHDKQLEFEDWAKGVIKDQETEKRVREMHEKAYGLEHIKGDKERFRSENEGLKRSISETETTINTIVDYAKKGDFDSFFKAFDIPLEKVLQYAVSYAQRTPEQQQSVEERWRVQQDNSSYQRQMAELQASNQQLVVQQRTFELDMQLSKPDTTALAEAFDTRLGQPGAFRQEVIRRGQLYAAQGQDISAEQAVREVMQLIGPQGSTQQSMDGQPQLGTTPPKVVTPNQKPVIPNISGRGASVVKRTPKSLDDLRKLSEQFAASGG